MPQQQPADSHARPDKHQADSAVSAQSTDAGAKTDWVSVAFTADSHATQDRRVT